MKVTKSQVEKITLSDLDSLDPVHVFFEDVAPGWGTLTIYCWGDAWNMTWSAMGNGATIKQFLRSCNTGYIAGKLSTVPATEIDYDAISAVIGEDVDEHLDDYNCVLTVVYGEDWRHHLPQKPNPKYQYLCRVVDAVKAYLNDASAKGDE